MSRLSRAAAAKGPPTPAPTACSDKAHLPLHGAARSCSQDAERPRWRARSSCLPGGHVTAPLSAAGVRGVSAPAFGPDGPRGFERWPSGSARLCWLPGKGHCPSSQLDQPASHPLSPHPQNGAGLGRTSSVVGSAMCSINTLASSENALPAR